MTCIVGVIQKGKTFIGGDSAGVAGLEVSIRKDVKVFKIGDFVMGCTGSFRVIQLLRFSFTPPKMYPDTDIYQYMCVDFVNAVRKCFREGGVLEIDKNIESCIGKFLVGYKDRLFCIEYDYQVGENEKGYDAIGCAEPYALGALDATQETVDAEERIKQALQIAVYRSGGVRPPFIIEHT